MHFFKDDAGHLFSLMTIQKLQLVHAGDVVQAVLPIVSEFV